MSSCILWIENEDKRRGRIEFRLDMSFLFFLTNSPKIQELLEMFLKSAEVGKILNNISSWCITLKLIKVQKKSPPRTRSERQAEMRCARAHRGSRTPLPQMCVWDKDLTVISASKAELSRAEPEAIRLILFFFFNKVSVWSSLDRHVMDIWARSARETPCARGAHNFLPVRQDAAKEKPRLVSRST